MPAPQRGAFIVLYTQIGIVQLLEYSCEIANLTTGILIGTGTEHAQNLGQYFTHRANEDKPSRQDTQEDKAVTMAPAITSQN